MGGRAGNLVCHVAVDPATLRYVAVDEAFCQLTGYSREELIGLSVYAVALDNEPDRIPEMSRGRLLVTRRVRRKDGSTVPVWVDATLSGGHYIATMGILAAVVRMRRA